MLSSPPPPPIVPLEKSRLGSQTFPETDCWANSGLAEVTYSLSKQGLGEFVFAANSGD